MGPLVVSAVYAESDDALKDLGVKDSKKLTPRIRENMFEVIADSFKTTVVTVSASEIDDLRKHLTLNEIELDMFVRASSEVPVSRVYADCPDVNESGFSRDMRARMDGTDVLAKHKADDTYPIVSAASIIAKVTRDRSMENIQKEFGVNIGSGYPSDHYTMEFIEKWIKDNGRPPEHTRCSWEPVKRLMTVSKNTKISDW